MKYTKVRVPKTHCKRGHELTENNIYVYGSRRICKTCATMRAKKQYRREVIQTNLENGFCKRGHGLDLDMACPTCVARLYELRLQRELAETLQP